MSGPMEVRRRPIRAIQYDGKNVDAVVTFSDGLVQWHKPPFGLTGTACLRFCNGPQITRGEWIVWEPREGFVLYTDDAFQRIYEPAASPARTEPGDPT